MPQISLGGEFSAAVRAGFLDAGADVLLNAVLAEAVGAFKEDRGPEEHVADGAVEVVVEFAEGEEAEVDVVGDPTGEQLQNLEGLVFNNMLLFILHLIPGLSLHNAARLKATVFKNEHQRSQLPPGTPVITTIGQ